MGGGAGRVPSDLAEVHALLSDPDASVRGEGLRRVGCLAIWCVRPPPLLTLSDPTRSSDWHLCSGGRRRRSKQSCQVILLAGVPFRRAHPCPPRSPLTFRWCAALKVRLLAVHDSHVAKKITAAAGLGAGDEGEGMLRALCDLARAAPAWRALLRPWCLDVLVTIEALPPPPPCLLPPPPSFRFSGQTAGGGEGVGDGGADPVEVAEGGSKRRVGDWDCPGCGAMVWATKDQCFRCRAAKPKDAGDTNAIDPHTLFWETLHADLDVIRRGGEHGRCDESGGGLRRSRCLSQAQGQS